MYRGCSHNITESAEGGSGWGFQMITLTCNIDTIAMCKTDNGGGNKFSKK